MPQDSKSELRIELAAEPAMLQVGEIYPGVTELHLALVSRYDNPLEIIRVERSCGCTIVEVPATRLSPGDRVPVRCQFDTRGSLGSVSQYFRVVYRIVGEVGTEHSLTVPIEATVRPVCVLDPPNLEIRDAQRQHVWLKSLLDEPVEIVQVASEDLSVMVEIDQSRTGFSIALASEQFRQEQRTARVMVYTNSERQPAVSLPVDVCAEIGDHKSSLLSTQGAMK